MADGGGYEDQSSDVEDDVDSDTQPSSSVRDAKFGGGVGGAVGGLRGRTKWGSKGGVSRMGMRSSRVGGGALLDSDDDDETAAAGFVPAALTQTLPTQTPPAAGSDAGAEALDAVDAGGSDSEYVRLRRLAAKGGAHGRGGEGGDEDEREREELGYGRVGQGLEMEVESFREDEEIGDGAFGQAKEALRSQVTPLTCLPHEPEEEYANTFVSKFGNMQLSIPSPLTADVAHPSATPSPDWATSARGGAAAEERPSNLSKLDNMILSLPSAVSAANADARLRTDDEEVVLASAMAKFGNVRLGAPSASPSPPPCVSSHGSAGAPGRPCCPCALTPVLSDKLVTFAHTPPQES